MWPVTGNFRGVTPRLLRKPVKAPPRLKGDVTGGGLFPRQVNLIAMVKRLLTIDQAASFLGVRREFLDGLLKHGMGPATVQRKSYSLEYHIDDLRQYRGSDAMLKDFNALLALEAT